MLSARPTLQVLAMSAVFVLAGCASWVREDIEQGDLMGRVLVEWHKEDGFIYRKTKTGGNPVKFRPSWWPTNKFIIPEDMFTTGGSVPRVFWSIPGLSPWALGPAYIIHDWIFEVHRCPDRWAAHPEVAQITFEESALILAQIGKGLIDAGVIEHDMLEQIVWAVRTRYVRENIWDRPGTAEDCRVPDPPTKLRARRGVTKVVDFTIPLPRR
jgi:hypothetical protein